MLAFVIYENNESQNALPLQPESKKDTTQIK